MRQQNKHFLLTAVLMFYILSVSAHTFETGKIYYNITSSSNKTVEVTYRGSTFEQYTEYSGTVTIPSTVVHNNTTYRVTSIGSEAFCGCTSLTSITIPESVTSICDGAFYGCRSLTAISIPKFVNSIGNQAFLSCSGLTSIILPESVTSIGNHAFSECRGLTAITIPESVTSIGSGAFSSCTSLIELNIPKNVTSFEKSVFMNCSSLTSFTIHRGVTEIGNRAFERCSSLTSITCYAVTPPTIGAYSTFDEVDKSIPVYVLTESISSYKTAPFWSDFTNILPIDEYTLTVSSAGYATLFLNYNADIPENVKAYIATSVEDDRLMMKQVTGVLPAKTGVIVRAKEGLYTFVESTDTPTEVEGNLLIGTTTNTNIKAESGYRYYVLAKKDDLVAMYRPKLTDGQFLNNANRAYLKLESDDLGIFDEETNTEDEGGQLSNRLRFDFGGTTDVEMTTDNGQQTTVIYDLQGRKVADAEGLKGIYIVNGRKVIFK